MESLVTIFILIVAGYVMGSAAEARHYRSIRIREKTMLQFPAISSGKALMEKNIGHAELVYGNVVISIDYFKRILAGLRNILGGNVGAYETLLDRARREALLRMKEMAAGADMILNVRIETSSVSKSTHNKGLGSLEVLAYGTAVKITAKNDI